MTTEDIFAQLDPKLRKRLSLGDAIQLERLPVPSIGMTRALNGGLVFGRQVLIWGNKSAGKSSLCLQILAEAQRRGKTTAWIDVEGSFDPAWATDLGADPSKIIYSDDRSINDMAETGVNLIKAGVDVIVVDSISAGIPGAYFEKDSNDLKAVADSKQIGAESRDMGVAVKQWGAVNRHTLLILISQIRNNLAGLYASHMPTGGLATKHHSSTIIKLFSSESDSKAIKGKINVGDKILEEKIGREVDWHIDFNKTGPAFISGKYDFYFGGPLRGVDVVSDVFNTAEAIGIVEKGGAWYTVLGEKFQGSQKAIEWLRENPDALEKLVAKCL